jgi:hypothetical protein
VLINEGPSQAATKRECPGDHRMASSMLCFHLKWLDRRKTIRDVALNSSADGNPTDAAPQNESLAIRMILSRFSVAPQLITVNHQLQTT